MVTYDIESRVAYIVDDMFSGHGIVVVHLDEKNHWPYNLVCDERGRICLPFSIDNEKPTFDDKYLDEIFGRKGSLGSFRQELTSTLFLKIPHSFTPTPLFEEGSRERFFEFLREQSFPSYFIKDLNLTDYPYCAYGSFSLRITPMEPNREKQRKSLGIKVAKFLGGRRSLPGAI